MTKNNLREMGLSLKQRGIQKMNKRVSTVSIVVIFSGILLSYVPHSCTWLYVYDYAVQLRLN